mgnify:CR=1 FL=1
MENLREKKERSLVVGLIALIVIIVVLALIGLFLLKPEPQIIQGQAEATQVRVSGKLPGRVVEFMVGGTACSGGGYIGTYSFFVGRGETLTGRGYGNRS